MQITAASAILERLALENRRILSDWRGLILLRRATFDLPAAERRWDKLPGEPADLQSILRQMRQRQEIREIKGLRGTFEVIVPYARQGMLDEREMLFEANPYATLSHAAAFVFHNITEDFPSDLTVTVTRDLAHELLPLGTMSNDWEGVRLPLARRPATIKGRIVKWVTVNPGRFFGFGIFQPYGYPMRVTTLERTLIDGLQTPELCGGITRVLQAWAGAREVVNVEALVGQVERLDIGILRQRVGYVLETLSLNHPQLRQWRAGSQRGGSSRMVASAPFSPEYDERWNLSLNAPVHYLQHPS